MNERPTPETDAEHAQFAMGGFTLDFCRKLERERDEAREQLAAAKHFLEKYIAERDEARRKCANLEEIIRVEWPIVTVEALIRQAKESAK